MPISIRLDLSDEISSALDEAARDEGLPANDLIGRALKNYLFVRRFRQLRAETLEHMRATGQGDLSEEDVFRLVS
jgi:predicted transcriptional regulator